MKYRILLSAFLLATLLPLSVKAEYRVFLLKISKRSKDPGATPSFRLVKSTLDHLNYRYYYQVDADEDVTYISTWRCYGRTDFYKDFCPNPKDPPAEGDGGNRAPASAP